MTTITRDDIYSLAEEIADTVEEYPESDPAEVVDELVKIYATDESMTPAEEEWLRSEVWDRVNDRR